MTNENERQPIFLTYRVRNIDGENSVEFVPTSERDSELLSNILTTGDAVTIQARVAETKTRGGYYRSPEFGADQVGFRFAIVLDLADIRLVKP